MTDVITLELEFLFKKEKDPNHLFYIIHVPRSLQAVYLTKVLVLKWLDEHYALFTNISSQFILFFIIYHCQLQGIKIK